MKLALSALALAGLLSSCATKTIPPVAAPTVPPPVRAPDVDLRPVERIVRIVDESSDELREEVAEARTESEALSVALQDAVGRHGATEMELEALAGMARATEQSLLQIQIVANRQKTEIAGLRETLQETALRVTEAQSERDNLRAALAEANLRIETLTTVSQDIAAERDTARADLVVANRWKWRFFWWAVGVSGLVVVYVFLRLYPATSRLIP